MNHLIGVLLIRNHVRLTGLLVYLRSLNDSDPGAHPSTTWMPQKNFSTFRVMKLRDRFMGIKLGGRVVYTPRNDLTTKVMVDAFGMSMI